MAYMANPCVRTDLHVRLVWCLVRIKKWEYEATIETKAGKQQLELMRTLKGLIPRDVSAIAWAKRKDALCFVKIVVDRVPTPVLEECVKAIRQKSMKREEVLNDLNDVNPDKGVKRLGYLPEIGGSQEVFQ